jgi:hypothetical protein
VITEDDLDDTAASPVKNPEETMTESVDHSTDSGAKRRLNLDENILSEREDGGANLMIMDGTMHASATEHESEEDHTKRPKEGWSCLPFTRIGGFPRGTCPDTMKILGMNC